MATKKAAGELIDYSDLYARWERGNWSATTIDFRADREDWEKKLTPEQRKGAQWLFSLFFHGEDAVTDALSPYIDAAPKEEQKYFLATQQADEARHSVFFHRFFQEVTDVEAHNVSQSLSATKDSLTWGHKQIFDRLDTVAKKLQVTQSRELLAQAITLYHITVEGTLAQPGQHMIEEMLERTGFLPGFLAGMKNVSIDEQRHIGFGVKILSELVAEENNRLGDDPLTYPRPIQDAIVQTIRDTLVWSASVLIPPGWDRTYTDAWGFTVEELGEHGARGLEQRLRAIGLPVEELPGLPLHLRRTPRERVVRALKLIQAGFIGPVVDHSQRDITTENLELFMELLALRADPRRMRPGTILRWQFKDMESWDLTFSSERCYAEQSTKKKADLILSCELNDWLDISAKKEKILKMVATGKLELAGKIPLFLTLRTVF